MTNPLHEKVLGAGGALLLASLVLRAALPTSFGPENRVQVLANELVVISLWLGVLCVGAYLLTLLLPSARRTASAPVEVLPGVTLAAAAAGLLVLSLVLRVLTASPTAVGRGSVLLGYLGLMAFWLGMLCVAAHLAHLVLRSTASDDEPASHGSTGQVSSS